METEYRHSLEHVVKVVVGRQYLSDPFRMVFHIRWFFADRESVFESFIYPDKVRFIAEMFRNQGWKSTYDESFDLAIWTPSDMDTAPPEGAHSANAIG